MPPPPAVVGVGNALLDVLAPSTDDFLADHGLVKGTMRLCDADEADRLYAAMPPGTESSGGSAANTMVGVASFGGRAAFVGKVRDDQLGHVFAHDIRAAGVDFVTEMAPASSPLPTGRCLVLITPDAQRTLNTSLGVAGDLSAADVPEAVVTAAQIVFLEAFLWEAPGSREAMLHAVEVARGAGVKVAFSLSDPLCVDRNRDDFLRLVRDVVDVLFANESEVLSLFGVRTFDEAVQRVRDVGCSFAALTRGALGSVILAGGDTHVVDAAPVAEVVDTTGAGDVYAAGVLFGLTSGLPPAECGRLGALAAGEVIAHVGGRPERSLRELVGLG